MNRTKPSRKRTHFRVTDKDLTEVPDLNLWRKQLLVVHLERNRLERWNPNLRSLERLTHLYLEDNDIFSTAEINNLPHLEKIYLARNKLTVVEGFSQCWSLRHFEVQKQRMAIGDQLVFHPLTLSALQGSLEYLNISENNVDTLDDLASLHQLEAVVAENNAIADMHAFRLALRKWIRLKSASFRGNPVQADREYRKVAVLSSRSLCILDGKPITDTQRQVIQAVHIRKEKAVHSGTKAVDGKSTGMEVLTGYAEPFSAPEENKGKVFGVLCDPMHENKTPSLAIPDCIPRSLWKVQNFACFFRQNNQKRRLKEPSSNVTLQGQPPAVSEATASAAENIQGEALEGFAMERLPIPHGHVVRFACATEIIGTADDHLMQ